MFLILSVCNTRCSVGVGAPSGIGAAARHRAFCANFARPIKALDRVIDKVNDILVADFCVHSVGIALLDGKRTRPILQDLALDPVIRIIAVCAVDVRDDMQAVQHKRRCVSRLVHKCRVVSVALG